ncbi:DUF4097 family beta strand repeat-containing protein [bacterium]
MKRKNFLSIILCGVFLLALSCFIGCEGQSVSGSQNTASAPFDFTYAVNGYTTLDLRGINGSIDITGDNTTDSIHVWGVRMVKADTQTEADAHLADVQVDVTNTAPTLLVETDQPTTSSGRTYEVTYHITLPEGLLILVANVNGNIVVEDIANNVTAGLTNGNIVITNIRGNIFAVNVNGDINCQSMLVLNGTCQLTLVNGNINMEVPADTNAQVTMTIVNGAISVNNLTLTGSTITPTVVTGTLGTGTGTIIMGLTNGNITLEGY